MLVRWTVGALCHHRRKAKTQGRLMIDLDEPCDCGGAFRFTFEDVAKERTVRCSLGCG